MVETVRIIGASILVLLVPGYAWQLCFSFPQQDPTEKLASIIGSSITINALVSLLFFILNIKLNVVWLILLFSILLLTSILLRLRKRVAITINISTLVTFFLVSLLILWRYYQARNLVLPAWVDSPHHTLILRTIVEAGGLPSNLSPYLQIPFAYHFGFHTTSGLFSILSGLPPEQAILIFGQVISAAVCLSVYRLVKVIWNDWHRAIIAGLLVGFFSQMPAFFLSWGRYTLLTGLVILPLALAALYELKRNPSHRRLSLQLAIYISGIFLSHYFIGILFLIFILSLCIEWFLIKYLLRTRSLPPLKTILSASAIGILISSPWLYRAIRFSRELQPAHVLNQILNTNGDWFSNPTYLLQLAGPTRAYLLLLTGLIGSIFLMRSKKFSAFLIWTLFLVIGCIPKFNPLSIIRPDHFIIILFLPACVYSSHFIIQSMEGLTRVTRKQWISHILLICVTLSLCIWGIIETCNILNPTTILASADDKQALDWIKINTPDDARFFINTVHWQGNIFRGVDGGIWILPLTGRWTIVPPITYSLGDLEYLDEIAHLAGQASQLADCTIDFWTLIEHERISHIFVKNGAGLLQPEMLDNCHTPQYNGYWLDEVAHFGSVYVYQVEKE